MSDDTVSLREHLEMRIAYLQELRQEDRQMYLQMMGDWNTWREEVSEEIAAMKARIATVVAALTVLIALLQLWRGLP